MNHITRPGKRRRPPAMEATRNRLFAGNVLPGSAGGGHEPEDEPALADINDSLDELCNAGTDFDTDAVELVADVRRTHCDGEAPSGHQW